MDFYLFLKKLYDFNPIGSGKFIKHSSKEYDLKELWIKGELETYQSLQKHDVFNCDFIISFIGEEKDRARFLGVYKVNSKKSIDECDISFQKRQEIHTNEAKYYYDLEKYSGFEELEGRVIIKWGGSRNWHHSVEKTNKRIWQILPSGYYKNFEGLDKLWITFTELKWLVNNRDANSAWYYSLSNCSGVYMIVDSKTGDQYIGSAVGKDGLWGRWERYVQTNGTGGNKRLTELIENNQDYVLRLSFSILKYFPKEIDKEIVLQSESFYKKALGTRIFGLNEN